MFVFWARSFKVLINSLRSSPLMGIRLIRLLFASMAVTVIKLAPWQGRPKKALRAIRKASSSISILSKMHLNTNYENIKRDLLF
jgi:hypothetical protein